MKYRPEIDGLRAIAVVPVILFHAGYGLFSGGFIGVDVFYVISGYLITTIIVNERDQEKFSLLHFYERRARRILPALFFVTLVTIPFCYAWMLPDAFENFGESIVATTFFSNNILLWITSDYWDITSEFKPLLHTWSLGIEEQFYIFFPLFLLLTWSLGRRKIVAILVAVSCISLTLSHWGFFIGEQANFYLLPTRGWELLMGALCALYLVRRGFSSNIHVNTLFSSIGFLAIAYAIVAYDEHTPFPSLYALAPTLGALLIALFAVQGTPVHWLLSRRALVAIGLISYSAYLWHQPIFSISRIQSTDSLGEIQTLLLIVLTILFSILTWKFVERPFRNKNVISTRVLVSSGTILAVVLSGFGLVIFATRGLPARVFPDDTADIVAKYKSYNQAIFNFKSPEFSSGNATTKVLLIGNSFARDIGNMILETFDTSEAELIYRYDQDVCSVRDAIVDKQKLGDADLILVGSSYQYEPLCARQLIEVASREGRSVFFFGNKHFGYNLNWITQVAVEARAFLTNRVPLDELARERELRRLVPEANFIPIMDSIMTDGQILITDAEGRLLSGDGRHLTRPGAIMLGQRVLLASQISHFFKVPANSRLSVRLPQAPSAAGK